MKTKKLMASAANGNVRLYRNYDPAYTDTGVELTSAFVGLDDRLFLKRGAGVVTDWNQQSAALLCAGDSRVVKVWNADHEISSMVCPTQSLATSTSSLRASGHQHEFREPRDVPGV